MGKVASFDYQKLKILLEKSKGTSNKNKGKTSNCRPLMTKQFKNRRKSKKARMRACVRLKGSLTN